MEQRINADVPENLLWNLKLHLQSLKPFKGRNLKRWLRSTKNEIRTGIFINLNIYAGPVVRRKRSTLALVYPSRAWFSMGRLESKMAFKSNWFKRKKKKERDTPPPPRPKFPSVTFSVLKVEIEDLSFMPRVCHEWLRLVSHIALGCGHMLCGIYWSGW